MRFAATVLALAAALLVVGGFQLTRVGSTAALLAQETLTFEAVGGSGISGTVTLTAVDDNVEVVVETTGLAADNTYVSGAYDSTSQTCVGGLLGSFSSSFQAADGGVTYTVPDTALSDVFSVSIRDVTDTGSPPGTVVACAERAAEEPPAEDEEEPAADGLPDTGGPPPESGNGTQAWSYLLIAAGVLALLGSGTLALRLRRQR